LVAALPTHPTAIVAYLYAHPDRVYTRHQKSLSGDFFTPHLLRLYRKDQENSQGGSPSLDFDFLSNSQDPDVTQVKVSVDPKGSTDGHQTVIVHFLEGGNPETELFFFERHQDKWLIAEVQCATPGRTWILSKTLEGHP
jgi:hypothetical protein